MRVVFLAAVMVELVAAASQGFIFATNASVAAVPPSSAAADAQSVSCCSLLEQKLGSKLSYPKDLAYTNSTTGYWSAQEQELSPTCVIRPSNVDDVSEAVKVLTSLECRFAIRSGGHMTWRGAANIDQGVTIDLTPISEVTLAADRKTAVLGSGATWGKAYRTLDALNSSVVGGRFSLVGVGGLLVGGGNSFFTARYGFACDNVYNYEMVLPNGTIANINQTSAPDLFRALKGGSNNFGIITRFTVHAFDLTELWGGIVTYDGMSTTPAQLRNLVNFTDNIQADPYASLIEIHVFTLPGINGTQIFNLYDYTKPDPNPAPFQQLLAMGPESSNNLGLTKLAPLIDQLPNAANARNLFATLTLTNSLPALERVRAIFAAHHAATRAQGFYTTYMIELQPLPALFANLSLARGGGGGNVLGLPDKQNSIIVLFQLAWDAPRHDAANERLARDVVAEVTAYLKSVDAYVPWEYLNYADGWQDPIAGYGAENGRFLREVQARYDPGGRWARLVGGGFKLDRGGQS